MSSKIDSTSLQFALSSKLNKAAKAVSQRILTQEAFLKMDLLSYHCLVCLPSMSTYKEGSLFIPISEQAIRSSCYAIYLRGGPRAFEEVAYFGNGIEKQKPSFGDLVGYRMGAGAYFKDEHDNTFIVLKDNDVFFVEHQSDDIVT